MRVQEEHLETPAITAETDVLCAGVRTPGVRTPDARCAPVRVLRCARIDRAVRGRASRRARRGSARRARRVRACLALRGPCAPTCTIAGGGRVSYLHRVGSRTGGQ